MKQSYINLLLLKLSWGNDGNIGLVILNILLKQRKGRMFGDEKIVDGIMVDGLEDKY